jgi:alpha-galactosidase
MPFQPGKSKKDYFLRYPDKVSIRSEGKWFALKGKADRWSDQDMEIRFLQREDGLTVFVQSPTRALEFMRCSWDKVFANSLKSLNDHWERSYGDLSWQSIELKRRSPWYTLISDGTKTQAFGVKTAGATIASWTVGPGSLELLLDTHSGGDGVLLGDRKLEAAHILATENQVGENPFETDIRFCKMMCPHPKLPSQPVYGINDWYFAYGNNSRELILQTTGTMAALAQNPSNPPFSVIDMGWSVKPEKSIHEFCWGDDFTRGNDKFGDMSQVASGIKKLGMRPGLWTRPLLANGRDNPSALIALRSDQTDPKERYLDPTVPENLVGIGNTIRLYKNWGYQLVKHDYTSYDLFGRWGFQMNEHMTVPGWHFNDRSKTNAEIMLELYQTIRQAAGDMLLMGCNTFSHLSAGIFDINRIGDDTSGKEWARTLKMGVNTLGFRLPQHNTFYAADGDCVGLTTKIPWKENQQWLNLLAQSSAPLFISAEPEALGSVQKTAIQKAFSQAAAIQSLAEPMDWMTNPRPSVWKLNGHINHFDWT